MVNVIMPIYNGAEYISTPLDSLIKQTIDKGEFTVSIIQDFDGLDYTNIINEYKDKGLNINFVKADRHLTQGPARQLGIDSLPEAEYIMFLDQDDFLYKNAIKQLLHTIEATEADIVFSTYIKETKDDEETVNQNHADIITQLHGKLFRKSYLDKNEIRFLNELKYSEDSAFNLMAFYETDKKQFLNEVTYYWNYNENSQSRSNEMDYFQNMYADYIIGQLRGLEHINEHLEKGVDKNLLRYIIVYLYSVINIENSMGYTNYKYKDVLKEFGRLDFVKEIMDDEESDKYFASNVHGGMVFINKPLFFQIPFDSWVERWYNK